MHTSFNTLLHLQVLKAELSPPTTTAQDPSPPLWTRKTPQPRSSSSKAARPSQKTNDTVMLDSVQSTPVSRDIARMMNVNHYMTSFYSSTITDKRASIRTVTSTARRDLTPRSSNHEHKVNPAIRDIFQTLILQFIKQEPRTLLPP